MQEAFTNCSNFFGFCVGEPYRSIVMVIVFAFSATVGIGLFVLYRKRMVRQALTLFAIASFIIALPFIYGSVENIYSYIESNKEFENALASCGMDSSCNKADIISSFTYRNTLDVYLGRIINFTIGGVILISVGVILVVINFRRHHAKAKQLRLP